MSLISKETEIRERQKMEMSYNNCHDLNII